MLFFSSGKNDEEVISKIKANDLKIITQLYQEFYPVIFEQVKKETEAKSLLQSAILILRNLIVTNKFGHKISIEKFITTWCFKHWEENHQDVQLEAKIYDSLKANDGWAFYYINMTYFPSVLQYVKLHGGTKEDAEDVMQDAILALINNVNEGKYQPRANVKTKTYFVGICKNLWQDRIRKGAKVKNFSQIEEIDWDQMENYDFWYEVIDQDHLNSRQKMVQEVFTLASETCKKVLSYFYHRNLSHEEIAEELGFSNAESSKTQKNKCLKKLKVVLSKKIDKD